MKKYISPRIEFNTLQTKEKIADTCWGYSANNKNSSVMHYDIPGLGYLSFILTKNPDKKKQNCAAGPYPTAIEYHDKSGTSDGSNYFNALCEELIRKGGSNGQPYGNLTIDFPTTPDPSWS